MATHKYGYCMFCHTSLADMCCLPSLLRPRSLYISGVVLCIVHAHIYAHVVMCYCLYAPFYMNIVQSLFCAFLMMSLSVMQLSADLASVC